MESGVINPARWRPFAELTRPAKSRETRGVARTAPVARPKTPPAEMHDAHLANAIDKANRENNTARLGELEAERERRGGGDR